MYNNPVCGDIVDKNSKHYKPRLSLIEKNSKKVYKKRYVIF